jgi:hypothetical protein
MYLHELSMQQATHTSAKALMKMLMDAPADLTVAISTRTQHCSRCEMLP